LAKYIIARVSYPLSRGQKALTTTSGEDILGLVTIFKLVPLAHYAGRVVI